MLYRSGTYDSSEAIETFKSLYILNSSSELVQKSKSSHFDDCSKLNYHYVLSPSLAEALLQAGDCQGKKGKVYVFINIF